MFTPFDPIIDQLREEAQKWRKDAEIRWRPNDYCGDIHKPILEFCVYIKEKEYMAMLDFTGTSIRIDKESLSQYMAAIMWELTMKQGQE